MSQLIPQSYEGRLDNGSVRTQKRLDISPPRSAWFPILAGLLLAPSLAYVVLFMITALQPVVFIGLAILLPAVTLLIAVLAMVPLLAHPELQRHRTSGRAEWPD